MTNESKELILKRCPFCESKASVTDINQSYGDGAYRNSVRIFNITCTICGASRKGEQVESFADFTDYRVSDFRKDEGLRNIEQRKYDKYIEEKIIQISKKWNERAAK